MLATWPRERLEKELAQQAKENAALRERVARLECEVFWLKVPAPALPDLTCTIHWLEGGCDPRRAADELRAYQRKMGQPEAPALARETPP